LSAPSSCSLASNWFCSRTMLLLATLTSICKGQ
jgi:hypothetical protein